MLSRSLAPNVISYSAAISACAKGSAGKIEKGTARAWIVIDIYIACVCVCVMCIVDMGIILLIYCYYYYY